MISDRTGAATLHRHASKRRLPERKCCIEGDVKGFSDNISPEVRINMLKERIADEKFIRPVRKLLNAGYIEHRKFYKTYSTTPHGGIIRASIYSTRELICRHCLPTVKRHCGERSNPCTGHGKGRNRFKKRLLRNRAACLVMQLFTAGSLLIMPVMGVGLYGKAADVLKENSAWSLLTGEFGFRSFILSSVCVTVLSVRAPFKWSQKGGLVSSSGKTRCISAVTIHTACPPPRHRTE
jgi:hypothetical protein